ncbi:MAG: NUDIX domain-containing protein [bacterium]|nr:NUDIX domain-containing protein [bacterium]
MDNIQEKIIERVRAIIVDSGKILLINRLERDESYWVIPGGGVEQGESREQAVERECLEELGIKVQVKRLFLRRIGDKPGMEGQHEFFYLCSMVGGKVGTGQGPEFQPRTQYKGEYKIGWVDLKKLLDINLKPQEVKNRIIQEYLVNK